MSQNLRKKQIVTSKYSLFHICFRYTMQRVTLWQAPAHSPELISWCVCSLFNSEWLTYQWAYVWAYLNKWKYELAYKSSCRNSFISASSVGTLRKMRVYRREDWMAIYIQSKSNKIVSTDGFCGRFISVNQKWVNSVVDQRILEPGIFVVSACGQQPSLARHLAALFWYSPVLDQLFLAVTIWLPFDTYWHRNSCF